MFFHKVFFIDLNKGGINESRLLVAITKTPIFDITNKF